MSEHYTDEDVRVAYDAWDGQPAIPGNHDSIRAVLDAVAPAIAARALREAAEEMATMRYGTWNGSTRAVTGGRSWGAWLHVRADEIEDGASG